MFLNYLLFIIILNIINFSKNQKLIFAEIHFRHGARSPTKLDENGTDALGVKWSAPGELTAVGKRMHYLLGLRNRKRYINREDNFLSEQYDPHELLIFSSNVNRTIQSVGAQIQGFYPSSPDELSAEQYKTAVPPINFDGIENETNKLNESALPNYMTILPIHHISFTNSSINCTEKVRAHFLNNLNTTPTLLSYVDEFNKNFREKLNIYLNFTEDHVFNFSTPMGLCDSLIAEEAEKKDNSEYFQKTKIDKDSLVQSCLRALTINFRDIYHGDTNKELVRYYSSYLLREMSNRMKRRVDDDIQGDISKQNSSDYSRPKMIFISGHDTSLSAQEMFFIRFLDLPLEETYILPTFASQITYEITRKEVEDNERSKLKYSDYTVKYFFNDKLIFSKKLDEFLELIDNNTWDLNQIISFCHVEQVQTKPVDTSMIIIIFMAIIILILIIVIIILALKLKGKTEITVLDDKNDGNERIINDDEDN